MEGGMLPVAVIVIGVAQYGGVVVDLVAAEVADGPAVVAEASAGLVVEVLAVVEQVAAGRRNYTNTVGLCIKILSN